MKRPRSDYVIQTVANALRLLEAFEDEEELGVTELSRRLALHKNNVFRLLATLEQQGYVEQCAASDRYRLGVRCLELGQAFARTRSLARLARPVLVELAQDCGESAHLGALRGFEVVHLDGEQPDRLVLCGARLGRTLPVHCTALGKVLIACGEPALLEAFDRELAGEALPGHTDDTLTDRDKLLEHLRGVAAQGYGLDLEECEQGLTCAAAPVYAEGRLVAALSVSGPAFRLTEEALRSDILPRVLDAAESLTRQLG